MPPERPVQDWLVTRPESSRVERTMTAGDHPTRERLRQFVTGELSRTDSLRMAWHLYNCAECSLEARQSPAGGPLLTRLFVHLNPTDAEPEQPDYESAVERGLDLFFARKHDLDSQRMEAPALFSELQRHPPTRQKVLIRNARRYRSWALVEFLLETCERAWFDRHEQAEAAATLALEVAESLDPSAYTPRLIEDLQGRCWIHVANSRRVCGDLSGGEDAFRLAERHLKLGTEEPGAWADLLRYQGILRRDQRNLPEAEALFGEAASLFRRIGDQHGAGRTLVSLANVHMTNGEPERAIEVLQQAMELVEPDRDPALTLGMRHNLIDYLAEAGRTMEAHALLARSRDLYRRAADPSLRRKLAWVRGKIARGLGQAQQAESWFAQARREYAEEGLAFDFALVSLELAALYARDGRAADVLRMAEEILPIFQALEIRRETLAALALLVDAARKEEVTSALLREIAGQLRREQQPQPRDAMS